ncbi:hypothetical protein C2845_PM03G17780 [Panicum miliaceum]|uniref:Plus3 domain-containing protein n=1 Tax=Panicum miliaceum TaxID=4540 RepID=A0A3L6T5W3_PANMI|nr:hypothetical protein C2845_PM03G17780 [Panicum miliaceum]
MICSCRPPVGRGRTSPGRATSSGNSGGSGSDGFDDDDDSDAAPTYSRKKPTSQVPLKKRHQPEKGGRRGGAGGGATMRMTMMMGAQADGAGVLVQGGLPEGSSPPPPPSRMLSSTWTDKSGSATKSTLDELRAKQMRQQDPEAYRNRRRAGSPPSDGSNDGDNRGRLNDHGRIADDVRDDEFDESPSRLDPLKFDDVKSITLRRSKLVKWFMEPFFEDLMSGCFVRLGIGKTKNGTPRYRLCIVRNVDASDPDRKYKLESYTMCKYLNVVWDSEANAARWQMTQVSDSPPNEEEFKEWLQEAEKNGARIPTRQEVLEKKDAIQEAYNFVYLAGTVKKMLQQKSAVRRPINVAAEKDRLRNELEMALGRGNGAEAERIRAKLNSLQNMSQPMSKNEKAAKLEANT